MLAFRITRRPHTNLEGTGGLYAAGRWHSRGRPVVYASASRALAILEALVHTDPEDLPDDLVLLTLEMPDDIAREEVTPDALPDGWRAPFSAECRPVGDAWLSRLSAPLLVVPSVVAPGEHNILVNPAHPDAAAIRIRHQEAFLFDARLLAPVRR
jgi:RES domain-containing protein